jgi:hypothetical protein
MRSLKKDDSLILKGIQILHNFIRSHMGIDGMVPSEKAGIKVRGIEQMDYNYSKCKQKYLINIISSPTFLVSFAI